MTLWRSTASLPDTSGLPITLSGTNDATVASDARGVRALLTSLASLRRVSGGP